MIIMCEPRWKISLLVALYFVGWCTTLLWVPLLSDYFGRGKLTKLGNFINLLLYTVLLANQNFNIMLVTIFLFGVMSSIRLTISVPYFMELLPREKRAMAFTLCCIFDVSIYLFGTLYFWKMSKKWVYLCGIGYIL